MAPLIPRRPLPAGPGGKKTGSPWRIAAETDPAVTVANVLGEHNGDRGGELSVNAAAGQDGRWLGCARRSAPPTRRGCSGWTGGGEPPASAQAKQDQHDRHADQQGCRSAVSKPSVNQP
jgi:hypothetical protein